MSARIGSLVALVSLSIAGLAAPALADDCALADQVVEGCRTAPAPDPASQPQPQPQPQPTPEPQPEPSGGQSVAPGHQSAAVTRILTLMNGERRAAGLPLFSLRSDVSATSATHSEAMAAGGNIWHNDAYFTAANKKRLGAALLGENVARNPEIDDAHVRLMNSPGHRANILDRRFTVVGLAVYRSSTGSLYVTQNFVQPAGKAVEAPRVAAPASKPAAAKPAAPAAAPAPTPPAAPATEAAPPVPAVEVLAAGPVSQLLAAPAGLGGPAGSQPPAAALAGLVALALLAGVAVAVSRRHSLFAPLLSRIGR